MSFVKNAKCTTNNKKCISGSRIAEILELANSPRISIFRDDIDSGSVTRKKCAIDRLDLEILISHVIRKPREFVLANPDYKLSWYQTLRIKYYTWQRSNSKPVAYITGHKEFYGLDFEVSNHTLVPRPETELIVDLVLENIQNQKKKMPATIIDIGTGSGNIIISVAKNLQSASYFATDISNEAIKVAKKNAKKHNVDNKIKFLHGNLLEPVLSDLQSSSVISEDSISQRAKRVDRNTAIRDPETRSRISDFSSDHSSREKSTFRDDIHLIITANLPYLSKEIYNSSPDDVKKHEPRSALYSDNEGLDHYEKLLRQILEQFMIYDLRFTIFLEISPEQKNMTEKLVKKYFPRSKNKFYKDLAGKWRVCEIKQ